MNKRLGVFSVAGLGLLALGIHACSDSTTTAVVQVVVRYENDAARPPCDANTDLQVALSTAEGTLAFCSNGTKRTADVSFGAQQKGDGRGSADVRVIGECGQLTLRDFAGATRLAVWRRAA